MDLASVNCKAIILKKLSGAVVCSILGQLVTLFGFLFVTNINIFYPLEWFTSVFKTVTSISTWLYIFPLASIIFAQSIVYAKDYVVEPKYSVSKFGKLLLYFSTHNIALMLLNMMSGFLNIWLYLSISGDRYNVLYISNEKNDFFLVEENLFMILSGFWTGFFFFTTYCNQEKNIQFPVLQQKKLVQFKTKFFPLFEESRKMATWPAISYFLFYYFCRSILCQTISNLLNVIYEPTRLGVSFYAYVWLFTISYFFFINLMGLLFKLFLTEEIQFSLGENTETSIPLTIGIECNSLPIIQHLACLDLYLLSIWSITRRKVLFSLSQPGEHPHYWNKVFVSSLKIISHFTKNLNNLVSSILEVSKKEEAVEKKIPLTVRPEIEIEQNRIIISPFKSASLKNVINPYTNVDGHKQPFDQTGSSNPKYRNMRNLTLFNTEPSIETVQVMYHFPKLITKQMKLYSNIKVKLSGFMIKLKKIFAFNYLFGEIIEVKVHTLLRSGQVIIWLIQALSHLVVVAYSEDTYGVVQKDLHTLIIALLELREGIEKLNRLLILNKKGCAFKEHSIRMKQNINAVAKRCLYSICLTYKDCIGNLPLNQEILLQLQYYKPTDETCRTVPAYKGSISEDIY